MRRFKLSADGRWLLFVAFIVAIAIYVVVWNVINKEPNTGDTGVEIVEMTKIDNVITLNPERKNLDIRIAEEGQEGFYITEEGLLVEDKGVLFSFSDEIDFGSGLMAPTQIIIQGEEDEDICILDWSTGKLEFRGKMSSSARSFFKYFLKPYVDEYIDSKLSEFVDQKLEEGRKKNEK